MSLELQRIRLDQLDAYLAKGWRPVQEVDGAVGATPYSQGHGAEVLVMREIEHLVRKTYGTFQLTQDVLAASMAPDRRSIVDELDDMLAPGRARGAFRALAMVGLAVAYGRAMHLVDSVTWGKDGRDFQAECLELLQALGLEAVVP